MAKQEKTPKRTTIYIDEDLHWTAREQAAKHKMTFSQYIVFLIEKDLNNE